MVVRRIAKPVAGFHFPEFRYLFSVCIKAILVVILLFVVPLTIAQNLDLPAKAKKGYFAPPDKKGPKKIIKHFKAAFDYGYKDISKRLDKESRKFSINIDQEEMPRWQVGDVEIWHEDPNVFLFSPQPSPNRAWVAYIAQIKSDNIRSSVTLANIDKSIQLPLLSWSQEATLYKKARSDYSFALDPGLTWSAAGQVLAVTGMQSGSQKDIFFFTLPMSEENLLIYYQVTNDEADEFQPLFSPSNEYFAYCSNDGGTFRVRYVNLNDWKVQTIDPEGSPSFSPDFNPKENILSYVRDDGGKYAIVTLNLEDGEEDVLVFDLPTPYIFPSWSPDGNWVAYYSDLAIYAVDVRSRDIHMMTGDAYATQQQTFLSKITWLPNSAQVMYLQDSQKKAPIYFSTNDDKGSTLIPWKKTSFNEQLYREGMLLFYASFHSRRWAIYTTKIIEYVPSERDIQDVVAARVYSALYTGNAKIEGEEEMRNISEGERKEGRILEAEITLLEPATASEELIYEMNETQKKKEFDTYKSFNYSDVFEQKQIFVQIVDKFAKSGRKYVLVYREDTSGGGPGGARR